MFSHSPEVKQVFNALFAAQKEFPDVKKDAKNPHFKSKYATLDSVKETLEPILRAYELGVSQPAAGDGVGTGCTTILFHSSGEWIAETLLLPSAGPGKDGSVNAQTGTAAVTYARRTGYLSIVGAIADNDDDGNSAVGRVVQKSTSQTKTVAKAGAAPQKAIIPSDLKQESAQKSAQTAAASETQTSSEPATAAESSNTKPTPKESEEFNKRFVSLTETLSKAGLAPSSGWPQQKKILAFLLSYANAENADRVSKEQWLEFFSRADARLATPEGTKKLIDFIEKAVAEVKTKKAK